MPKYKCRLDKKQTVSEQIEKLGTKIDFLTAVAAWHFSVTNLLSVTCSQETVCLEMSLSNGKQLLSQFFFSQLWLWPARAHGDPLGRAQCICLGVQHALKRWCYRLRIDSMGPNISAEKNEEEEDDFFSLAFLQHNARIFWEHVSALLSKTWRTGTHGLTLRSDISRTNTILVELRSVN